MTHQVIYPKMRAIRDLGYKRNDAGIQIPVGQEEIYYEALIDVHQLHSLAKRAARNKAGIANDGALRVRIIERRKL